MAESNNAAQTRKPPKVPKATIVTPEQEHPAQTTIPPEEVEGKDEQEYEVLKAVDHDKDSDDNPDYDLAV